LNQRTSSVKLSVIIPVSQAEVNLPKIENVILQGSSFSVQFVIVHDIMHEEESNSLVNLVNSYPGIDVTLLVIKAGNPGTARNAGLKLSRGSWIAFWDADDEAYLEEMLKLIDEAELGNFEVCIGSYQMINEEKVINHIINPRNGLNQVTANPGIWRFCFRSEIALSVEFPAIKMGEDQIYILQLNLPKKRKLFSERIVYRYICGQPHQATNLKSSRKEIKESLILAIRILVSQGSYNSKFTREIVARQIFTTLKVFGLQNLTTILISKKANLGLAHFLRLVPSLLKVALKMTHQKISSFPSRIQQGL
jgi:hypothetical protein